MRFALVCMQPDMAALLQQGHAISVTCSTADEQPSGTGSAAIPHAPAAMRQPRQMKMILPHKLPSGGATSTATPVPVTPEGWLAIAAARREPLSGTTNRAEHGNARRPAPPTQQPVSIFDMLSSGAERPAEGSEGGLHSSCQGDVLTARPEPAAMLDPRAIAASDIQARQ